MKKNELTITYICFYHKHCHFSKKALASNPRHFHKTTLCLLNLERENRGKPAFKLCDILESPNESRFKNEQNNWGEIDDQIKE